MSGIKNDELVNLKLIIEYDGKNYSGWQRQKKVKSVQQTIEEVLSKLFKGEKISLTGAGRTDAGVHAYGQCANFKLSKAKYNNFGIKKLFNAVNALLPDDILIKKMNIVPLEFNSRYSAKSREYIYRITSNSTAINRDRLYQIKYDIDLEIAKDFCKIITGVHSFRSLCKNKSDEHDFKCIVTHAAITKKSEGVLEFRITANRFLHSMIRAVIGAMLKVASGKMSMHEFTQKFKKGDEIKITYVPSHALFLSKVNY